MKNLGANGFDMITFSYANNDNKVRYKVGDRRDQIVVKSVNPIKTQIEDIIQIRKDYRGSVDSGTSPLAHEHAPIFNDSEMF